MSFRRRNISFSIFSLSLFAVAHEASAQQAQDTVSTLVVSAPRETAPYEAPSIQPLDVTQPTSLVTQHFIENNLAPTANYDDVIRITPSVQAVAPNGPGLQEDTFVSIRGFQDGQYNLTVDGLAWGDSNDFTHHTTSYLMANDIGVVAVDRGPGTAATLGDATFGGSVSIITKDPLERRTETVYASVASFGTYLGGAEIDTGPIAALGGAKAVLDVEHLQSNGFLSYSGQNRTNIFAKVIAPLNDRTTVTAVAMYNTLHQNVSLGSSLDQQAMFGYNYALNNNPSSQDYFGYNYDKIHTDIVYVAVKSDLGNGLNVDNKVYTYGYWHRGFNGEDPNGEYPNGTSNGPNNVPGQALVNDYYSVGDIIRLVKDFGFGDVKTGFWYDHQFNHRRLYEQDFTLGGVPNLLPNAPAGPIDRYQTNLLDTFQPYVEGDWKPLPNLTITAGVKYAYFRRTIHALVNQGTSAPLDFAKTYGQVLPSAEARYQIGDNWSFYAQAAKGFLAPNLNVFYVPNPGASADLKPQTSWNYQAGLSFRSSRLTFSADAYYIDFGNQIGKRTVQGQALFFNFGGVIYKGIEGEGTFNLVHGVSLYVNGSLNSAKDKLGGFTIPNSPTSTAAGGIIYDHSGFYAALLAKYVGPRFGDVPLAAGSPDGSIPLAGYATAQLSASYTFPRTDNRPTIKITGLIDNLFDKRGISALAGYSATASTPFYWNIVPRSYAMKISAAF